LSQTIQFLSRSCLRPATAVFTGWVQVRPPLVERLVRTAFPEGPLGVSTSASEETSQTLCAASYATAGSLTRSYGPATAVCLVIPGSVPLVHDAPSLVEVAKPMSDAPPSKKRPNWAAATIVGPCE
jgi:hypothetical protein